MDEDKIFNSTRQNRHLIFNFNGVYAAENLHLKTSTNSFAINNASPASSPGTRWIVLRKGYAYLITYFANPLAITLYSYNTFQTDFDKALLIA